MNTATKIVTSRAPVKEVIKDASMVKQKEMMAAHYDRLTSAPETGDKVAATFVPGNLNELIMCFDLREQPARGQCHPERAASY